MYRNVVYFIEKLVQIVFKKLKNQYHKDLSSKRSFFNRSKMISQPCSIDINTAWFNRAVMDLCPVNTARLVCKQSSIEKYGVQSPDRRTRDRETRDRET